MGPPEDLYPNVSEPGAGGHLFLWRSVYSHFIIPVKKLEKLISRLSQTAFNTNIVSIIYFIHNFVHEETTAMVFEYFEVLC